MKRFHRMNEMVIKSELVYIRHLFVWMVFKL